MTEMPFALPTLHIGALTRTEFARYVADLRAAAEDVVVLIRRGPHSTEECELAALDELPDAIANRVAFGAQVLYTFDRQRYRDVLLPLGVGLRLVRIQLDELERITPARDEPLRGRVDR
ncbi:MAG: hypothetical protein IPH13_08595 [Planctomycetes bacterium]|nr:hypothetical protein [Planctomycetota bacterium]